MQVLRVEKVEAGFRETGMLTRIAGMHRANSLFRIRLEVRGESRHNRIAIVIDCGASSSASAWRCAAGGRCSNDAQRYRA